MKRSRLYRSRALRRRHIHQHEPAAVVALHPGMIQNESLAAPDRQHQLVAMHQRYGNRAVQRTVASTDPMLHVGARSAAVQSLQGFLNQAGFQLNADGVFGPQTRQAVMQFQQANGLRPDGVVGPQTWSALRGGGGGGAQQQQQQEDPRAALVQTKLGQVKALFKLMSDQPNLPQGQQAQTQVEMPPLQTEAHPNHSHDWMDDAMDWVGDKAEDVGSAVGGAASAVGDAVGGAASAVGDAVGGAASAVGDAVGGAVDWAGDQANAVGSAVGGAVDWAGDQAGAAADWVGDKAGQAVDWAGDQVGAAADWVGDKASQAADWASETANDVGSWISDTAEEIGTAIQEEYDRLKDIVTAIGNSIDDALSQLDDLINDLKKKAGELFGADEEEQHEDPISFTMEDRHSPANIVTIACDGPVRRQRFNVNLQVVDSHGAAVGDALGTQVIAHDAVNPTLAYNGFVSMNDPELTKVPKGDFGTTGSRVNILTTKIDASYWGDYVNISATVKVEASWAITDSPGRTDVPDPDSAEGQELINEGNWASIASDLDPANSTGIYKGAPPRKFYWAKDLTSAHEKYHTEDIIAFAKAYMPTASEWLSQQSVEVPFFDTERQVRLQLNPLLESLTHRITMAINDHMGDSGEVRAHNAIRGSYEHRAERIRMIAHQKGWKAK